jgi:hypothetical protein
MWDQLRGVMKDPDNNPFPGFAEGPIDFPPTFKVCYLHTGGMIYSPIVRCMEVGPHYQS